MRFRHTARERIIKTLIFISFIFLLFQGCKPQPIETKFNALIAPPTGDDQEYTTMEDEPVEVSYAPVGNDNSIELWSKIAKRPSNGILENCSEGEAGLVTCTYVPNKDFNGKDSVLISQGDGKLISDNTPRLSIKVIPVNDAPVAKDDSFGFSTTEKKVYEILAPAAIDPDSVAQDLQYELISDGGATIESCFADKGDKRCALRVEDKSFEGVYKLRYIVRDQENAISNEATLTVDFSRNVNQTEVTFTQKEKSDKSGVDIVWVVDNSGSMNNDQENLKSNLQSFIDNFLVDGKARFDFKMGVATTDEHNNNVGLLETKPGGASYALTSQRAESSFAEFKKDFEDAVLVGTGGSGHEKSMLSLDVIYQNETAWFGADDRLLVAIVLSDEREQSSSKSPEEWAKHFQALKPDPNMVKIYPIVEISMDSDNCYKRIAEATGALRYSINDPFDDVLDQIGNAVATQLLSTFSINSSHEVLSLEVFVDGKLVAAGTEYTLENSNIVFVTPPSAGAEIKVRYSYKWK